jgi:hypothetical protein
VADASKYFFGSAMGVSADDSEVLVGAMGLYEALGAAFVFIRSGTGWSQQAELEVPWSSYYGVDVALSADGNRAAIGAEASDYQHDGAAYLFTRSGASWAVQAGVTDPDHHPSSSFGWRVALSRDGTTALVGADLADSAYVYTVVPVPPQQVTTPVQQGWNLIDLPLSATSPISASTVLHTVLQTSGGTVAVLYALHNGQWSAPLILRRGSNPSGADFALQSGEGYLLYSDEAGTFVQSGTMPTTPPAWTLNTGWNLVGPSLGATSPIIATTVLQGVLQSSGGTVAAIYALHNGQWSPPVILRRGSASSGTDFTLKPGLGYLLYTDMGTSYTPGTATAALRRFQPAGRSLPGSTKPPPPDLP